MSRINSPKPKINSQMTLRGSWNSPLPGNNRKKLILGNPLANSEDANIKKRKKGTTPEDKLDRDEWSEGSTRSLQ